MAKTSMIREFFSWISFLLTALYLKWQVGRKIKKLDNFIKDSIGKIRYSGTSMVHAEYRLPLTFKLREQVLNDDKFVSFYCEVKPDPLGDVVWLNEDMISVNSHSYWLARSPSRTTDPQVSPESPLIVRGEVFYPSWQERIKFTVKR